jgi:hypothetical protein
LDLWGFVKWLYSKLIPAVVLAIVVATIKLVSDEIVILSAVLATMNTGVDVHGLPGLGLVDEDLAPARQPDVALEENPN